MYKSIPIESYVPQKWPKLLKHVVVDQSYSQDFAINEFGHIRSDISLLFSSQSEEQAAAILKRLADVPASPDTKGLSDSEIISQIVPRNCQSPAQISSFMLRMQAAADKANATRKVDATNTKPAPPDGAVPVTNA